jgi:hypothetical protein
LAVALSSSSITRAGERSRLFERTILSKNIRRFSNGVIEPEGIRLTSTDVHSFPVIAKRNPSVLEVALYLSQTGEWAGQE